MIKENFPNRINGTQFPITPPNFHFSSSSEEEPYDLFLKAFREVKLFKSIAKTLIEQYCKTEIEDEDPYFIANLTTVLADMELPHLTTVIESLGHSENSTMLSAFRNLKAYCGNLRSNPSDNRETVLNDLSLHYNTVKEELEVIIGNCVKPSDLISLLILNDQKK